MQLQCTFRSGARRNQVTVFEQPFVLAGRHPECDLRFDPERDLEVSSRHASVTLQGGVYILRDLGSTNGTLVNGRPLRGEHVVAHRDLVRFGPTGPQVEFEVIPDPRGPGGFSGGPEPPGLPEPTPIPPTGTPRPPRRTPPDGIGMRIDDEPPPAASHGHRTVWGLLALLALLGAAFVWQSKRAADRVEAERAHLLDRVDSLTAALGGVQADIASLQGSLDAARRDAIALRTRIADGGDGTEITELRRVLDTALALRERLVSAASLDAAAIGRDNADGVAVIAVQFPDGQSWTGTGFAIASDGGGGYLLTNRHVVQEATGSVPARLGAIFNGSRQNFRARVVALHPDVDIALLRVDVAGGVPTVRLPASGITVAAGDPVVVIGFPLGLDIDMGGRWREVGVATTLIAGTVSKAVPRLIQLDGYGAQGSSGSPVFDADGAVAGVIYGGEKESQGRVVYAVPIRYGLELLAQAGGEP